LDILPKKRTSRAVTSVAVRKTHTVPTPRTSGRMPKPSSSLKRKLVGIGLVSFNLIVLGAVGYTALIYSGTKPTSYGVQKLNAMEQQSSPLDALSAADIAANIAQMAGLPEALAVTNQADTIDLYLNAAVIEKEYVTKTQVLSAAIKTKDDIVSHVVVDGDTIGSLAASYGVTSDSIKWSNDLRVDQLRVGTTLKIPPVNGLVHIVGVGDTPEKLAQTFSANAKEIVAFNDAEISGLVQGEVIIIPNGVKPRPVVAFKANYGYNGYWYGYCTWYVATRITVPNNWGNANRWDDNARLTPGWIVSSTPVVGAIAQSNSGPEGHVGIVQEVSADGTMIKYSDMNGLAGWGREGRTADWVPARARFQNFIYRAQ
jgi:LysM repeat protein